MAKRHLDDVGTVTTVTGDSVSVHRAHRLDWTDTGEHVLVAGDDVVMELTRRVKFVRLHPAQAVRLAALLISPIDAAEFTQGLAHTIEPDQGEDES